MFKDHLLLREYSGIPWSQGSVNREYLENLPIASAETTCRESSRYLLPRKNIFTFGVENGMTGPVVYYSCKMCNAFVKPHDIKNHMVNRHSQQENNVTIVPSTLSTTQPTNKTKKNSHKNKKKVVPPPDVPPPPLFLKPEFPTIPVVNITTSENTVPNKSREVIEEDVPPPPISVEVVEIESITHIKLEPPVPSPIITESSPIIDPVITEPIIVTTIPALVPVTTTSVISNDNSSATPVTLVAHVTPVTPVTSVTAKIITNLPILKVVGVPQPTTQLTSHAKNISKRILKNFATCKLYKKNKSYDLDKQCGVLDSLNVPCSRTILCTSHTMDEKRAVEGRIKDLNTLIREYKSTRVKSKPLLKLPITITPKQCTIQSVRNSFKLVEFLYDNKSKNIISNKSFKCEDSLLSSPLEDIKTIKTSQVAALTTEDGQTIKSIKLSGSCDAPTSIPLYLPLSPDRDQNGSGLSGEVPCSTMPTVYNLHPKPITVPTSALRRVGNGFVLQQAPRLERQRLDLQAVGNQHKQLKLTTPNKTVLLLNSNHKHSILKSNVKNNTKNTPIKRTLEKNSIGEIKHMKVITTDMNGFILNSDFSDSNELQSGSVQDKITVLK